MVIKIVAIGMVAVISALIVRGERPDIAVAIGIAGGAAILLSVIDGVTDLTTMLMELAEKTGVGGELIVYLMKIAGAGYIIEFACGAAEEAKMPSLSGSLSLAGKLLLIVMAIPLLAEIIDVILKLLSQT